MKSKRFLIMVTLLLTTMALPAAARLQDRGGQTLAPPVNLPCTVQISLIGQDLYHIKATATNNTGVWLPQGKKISWKDSMGHQGSLTLDVMVPPGGQFKVHEVDMMYLIANGPPKPPAVTYQAWFLK